MSQGNRPMPYETRALVHCVAGLKIPRADSPALSASADILKKQVLEWRQTNHDLDM